MPVPGSAGSVWAADTWAADTWTEDSWAAAGVAPEPPAQQAGSGGLSRVSRKDVEAIERLLRQRGKIKASGGSPEAELYGTVRNPTPVVAPKPKPVKVELPPEPRVGAVTAVASCVATGVGVVGFGAKDEAIAVAAAMVDPLYDWIMRELDL